jgi:hypothetical protein
VLAMAGVAFSSCLRKREERALAVESPLHDVHTFGRRREIGFGPVIPVTLGMATPGGVLADWEVQPPLLRGTGIQPSIWRDPSGCARRLSR